MRSVEAQACGPDELLATEADRRSPPVVFALIVVGAERGSSPFRRCRDALMSGRRVRGEPFQIDRGATEQELHVEGGCASAADAAERVLVLQLGDYALGIGHPSPVCPDTGFAFRAFLGGEREPLRVRARLATVAWQHRLLRRGVRDDPSLSGVL